MSNEIEKHFQELKSCLSKSISSFEDDPLGFRQRGIFQMGAFIRIFSQLMKSLDVQFREDVYSHDYLTDRIETFLNEWDRFLELVDARVIDFPSLYKFLFD